MIEAIAIVVPAHDEEELLPRCVASVLHAAAHPDLAAISVRVAVVLDRCSDASGDLAQSLLRASDLLLEQSAGNVGVARHAGIEGLLRAEAGRGTETVWVATTDADSLVPRDWLAQQVRLANAGADAVAGTVAVDHWDGHPPGSTHAFRAGYGASLNGAWHRHVHGANLGVRASTYERAGGIAQLPLGEDNALLEALEACGSAIARPRSLRVVTSGRREGRTAGGFSQYLRELSLDPPAVR